MNGQMGTPPYGTECVDAVGIHSFLIRVIRDFCPVAGNETAVASP